MQKPTYIIQGNIDFYKELLEDSDSEDEKMITPTDSKNDTINTNDKNDTTYNQDNPSEGTEYCLLSNEPLNNTIIELPCKHKFNYLYLYNEIVQQKLKTNDYEVTKLCHYQIKCPYCRNICNRLLPPSSEKFGLKGVTLNRFVNYPSVNIPIACKHIKTKTKNNEHNKPCDSTKVYVTDLGYYCSLHYTSLKKKLISKNVSDVSGTPSKNTNIQSNITTIINDLIDITENKTVPKENSFDYSQLHNMNPKFISIYHYISSCTNKIELLYVLRQYNLKNKHRIVLSGKKIDLIDRIFKFDLHKDPTLWTKCCIYNWLYSNKEHIKDTHMYLN